MSDSLAALGEAIGRQLARKQRPAGLSLELDHEPIVDAVKAAVHGSSEQTAAAIALAVKAMNEALAGSFSETSTELRLALNAVAAQIKAQPGTEKIVAAIDRHAQASAAQAAGLESMAAALVAMANAQKAEKVVEYDAQGRITRVKVI